MADAFWAALFQLSRHLSHHVTIPAMQMTQKPWRSQLYT